MIAVTSAMAQTPLYVGNAIHISEGATLFTQNHDVKFGANIEGTLVTGPNTTFSGQSDNGKVVGTIKAYPPFDNTVYPVGTEDRLFQLDLLLDEASAVPVVVSYKAAALPSGPASYNVDELPPSGYWNVTHPEAAKVTLRFDPATLPILEDNNPALLSIAGRTNGMWKIIPATVNLTAGTIVSNAFLPLSDYSQFALAIRRCAGSTTWNGSSWSNGAPLTSDVEVIIDGNYNAAGLPAIAACIFQVLGTSDVTIADGDVITVEGPVTIDPDATLTIESGGTLIQIGSETNEGDVTIKRDVMMRRLDYVYWGSPVSGQKLRPFSPMTLEDRFYVYDEPTQTIKSVFAPIASDGLGKDPATYIFEPGRGYIIRAPNDFLDAPAPPQLFTGSWKGTLQNGAYAVPVTHSPLSGVNLLGNPYPSPIDAGAFLAENPGTLYFWPHLEQVAGNIRYSMYNTLGAVSASGAADAEIPDGLIATGQGFLIDVPADGNVSFDNAMRTTSVPLAPIGDKSRFWLNLSGTSGSYNQILVGYTAAATAGFDVSLDGRQFGTGTLVSSLISDESMAIQARPAFDEEDVVALKFECGMAGNYTISIDHSDGVFATGQTIYLNDEVAGIQHDLSDGGYSFTSQAGSFDDRFTISYTENLGVPEHPQYDVVIFEKDDAIRILSENTTLDDVAVFDLRGRLLIHKTDIHGKEATIDANGMADGVVIVVVTTDKGKMSKKLIL